MPGYRPERVAEMIHRELAERLRSEIKDDRVGPISITSVKVTRDLSRAELSYMPLGGGQPSGELVEGLEAAARQLRGPIGRALRLRHAPELVFVYDERTDAAFRVTTLLDRLAAERRASDPASVADAGQDVDGDDLDGDDLDGDDLDGDDLDGDDLDGDDLDDEETGDDDTDGEDSEE